MSAAKTTAAYRRADAGHHLHPFTDHRALRRRGARIIVRAKGVYLWDSDGARILDGMAGLWCVNAGYGRRELAQEAMRQFRELPYYNHFFQCATPPAIALAEKLAKISPPGLNRAFFTSSGSEANDTVIRLARRYWAVCGKPDKTAIISRHNAYHGSTMGGASLGGMAFMHAQGGLPIPGIHHIRQPYHFGEGRDQSPADFGRRCARALDEKIDELGEDQVAAFIAEPVQGAGGVVIPPASYWPEIKRICKKRAVLLVADEVICGFGRLGEWFGSTYYKLRPDLMSFAKGLTSGYLPMGGVMVADDIAAAVGGEEFAHGFTYSGHPVCAAVALANIRLLEREKIIAKVKADIGPYFRKKFCELKNHPLVGEARAVGMLGALELVKDKKTGGRFAPQRFAPQRFAPQRFAPAGRAGELCRDFCIECGVVLRAVRDTIVASPPLIITKPQIDELCDKARRALDKTAAALS